MKTCSFRRPPCRRAVEDKERFPKAMNSGEIVDEDYSFLAWGGPGVRKKNGDSVKKTKTVNGDEKYDFT